MKSFRAAPNSGAGSNRSGRGRPRARCRRAVAVVAGEARGDGRACRMPDEDRRRRARALDQLVEPGQHTIGVQRSRSTSEAPCPGRSGTTTRCVVTRPGITRNQCAAFPAGPWRSTIGGPSPPANRTVETPAQLEPPRGHGDIGQQRLPGIVMRCHLFASLVSDRMDDNLLSASGRASVQSPNLRGRRLGGSTQAQTSLCSYAKAVAAARELTRSFVKMLLTWRSIVLSLRTSSAAIALFVAPAATRRRT